MGLCKCPKRKVTNQFCFEHKVNVCEHCMVQAHPKCIVQSYLHWLQDSDYSRECTLCKRNLSDEDCARLVCYHVFHWTCLDKLASQLPPTTAPAGYKCPVCSHPLFAPANLLSPVADKLRDGLSPRHWARAGLGLPLLDEPTVTKAPTPAENQHMKPVPTTYLSSTQAPAPRHQSNVNSLVSPDNNAPPLPPQNSIANAFEATFLPDRDEDKYRQRRRMCSPIWRWWAGSFGSRRPGMVMRWRRMVAVAIALGFGALVILALYGRGNAGVRDDPALDPRNNPHIRVQDT